MIACMIIDSLHEECPAGMSTTPTGGHGTNLAHWDSQKVLIDASIQVQHLVGLPFSLLPCGKGMVPFLP